VSSKIIAEQNAAENALINFGVIKEENNDSDYYGEISDDASEIYGEVSD